MIYLDTSALVKLYVEEEGRELVFAAVEESERVATSTVTYAETRAALARKRRADEMDEEGHRQAVADLDKQWSTYIRLNVSAPVAHHAGDLAERHALRGYDSVHLASAVRLRERFEDLQFLAFDGRLTRAVKAAAVVVYGDELEAEREMDGN